MQNLSLDFFNLPEEQQYHIYRISTSQVAQQPHSHDFFQICYVDCGHIEHYLDDTPVRLQSGDAFIVPPGCVHRIIFPENDVFLYSLSFSEALFHEGFRHSNVYHFMTALKLDTLEDRRIPIRSRVMLDSDRRHTLKALMEALLREQSSPCPTQLTAAGSFIASLLCILSQGYFLSDTNRERLQDVAQYQKCMEQCIQYIDQHFTQELTLNGLAHRFALSRSKFSLLFPQHTGMTLKRYIAQKRIDYAQMLIQSTCMTIQEVAQASGFRELSTFYRNFARVTGVHPSAYRAEDS